MWAMDRQLHRWALIASGFASVEAVPAGLTFAEAQGDKSWVHCWQNGLAKEDCCGATAEVQRASCWDSIFTEKECCNLDFARLFPVAEPDAPDWAAAAEWAAVSPVAGGTRGTETWTHPSLSRVQRRWEADMKNSTVALPQEMLGHRVNYLAFKRSGPAMSHVLEELSEDLYRLRHAAPPRRPANAPPLLAVDIGASIGAVAVLLAKLWGPGVKILAVEPAPANYRYLLWNIRINGVTDQVWPLNIAVGAESSAATAFVYSPTYPTWSQLSTHGAEALAEGGEGNKGKAVVKDEAWRGGWTDWQVRFETESATLAELLGAVGMSEVHFLKVDCEGCEWGVFAPLPWGRLKHRVRHVATELHDWALPNYTEGKSVDELDEETQELRRSVRDAVCVHVEVRENTLCSTM
mmetsp:Transcript_73495/g.237807  ORF Transcript_73495/g.237807 Transcript_73495/m.237807 type:complete len:407 (-) Transcript_73495:486-1706(-)